MSSVSKALESRPNFPDDTSIAVAARQHSYNHQLTDRGVRQVPARAVEDALIDAFIAGAKHVKDEL